MVKVDVMGRIIDYKPYQDGLYKRRMMMKILANRSFLRVFRPGDNITNEFVKYLQDTVDPEHQFTTNTVVGVHGLSGCQTAGSKVLMFDGSWKNIEDIEVGDEIITFDKDLSSRRGIILRTTEWKSTENYDVVQTNRQHKLLYSCSHNHIIPFYRNKGFRNGRGRRHEWVIDELTAKDFFNFSDSRLNHAIMGITCPAINKFSQKENCKIEPYTLGMYISDGSFHHYRTNGRNYAYLNITKMPGVHMDYIAQHYPFSGISNKKGSPAKTYRWGMDSEFAKVLREYGYNGVLAGKKFIPQEALFSDLEYRKKLLAGLIDGDGHFSSGYYDFITKSPTLAHQIEFLVHSVGGRVNSKRRKIGRIASSGFEDWYWRITFFIHENQGIPILTRTKDTESYYKTANRQSITLKKRPNNEMVYGFTVTGETGFYITDNWMLTHNTGKSLMFMSLVKLIIPDRFNHENFCFTDKQILEQAENLPKNSFVVRDEGTGKAIYGEGSMRTANQFQLLVETCRKYGLNVGLIEPSFVKYDIAKYYLETVDMDLHARITRVAVREPETLQYIGAIYVPVLPESDPDWIAYNVRKDEFIENMMQGTIADAKMDYEKIVKQLVAECDTEAYKNKGERLSFVKQKYPHFTLGEIKTIASLFEVQLRRNEYLGRFDNEHTERL